MSVTPSALNDIKKGPAITMEGLALAIVANMLGSCKEEWNKIVSLCDWERVI